jgi:glucose 1-dehydrogenase
MKLNGRNALVTGSDQGIGRSVALELAAEGANVVINYRHNQKGAEETRAEIEKRGGKSSVIQADVGKSREAIKLVADSIAALGSLDILVNNAGMEKRAPALDLTEEDYQAVIAVDLTAPLFLSQEFARHCRDSKHGGRIVNISSVHEELPFPHFTPYCMAKGGLKMMMRNLAIELAPLGITVNNIAPGAIETPINRKLMEDPKLLGALLQNIPLGRLGQPPDVAHAAVFLVSDDASYITGTTLFVDGGLLWNYSEQ